MNKKRMIQAMCALGLIYCMLFTTLYAKTQPAKEKPGAAIFVMATQNSVTACPKSYHYQSEVISLDMKIPQLQGLTDRTFQRQFNQNLLKEAKARKKNAISEALQYNKEMIRDGLKPLKFEYLESYTAIPSPYPYYTLEFFKYQYSGGAHGLGELRYITIDLIKNKIISLKDLFKPTVDYKALINAGINEQISRRIQQGEVFFVGDGGFVGIKDEQNFYINQDGLIVIVFNVYEIAPYAAGVIEIPLDMTKLLPYMK
ncbi:DUF3298 and DUF4163 domain-containing protein [Cellulosilyticum sp. ST5]|uniref:DUF3298 domain-containing protein n=1 Tax=Cellulosilyticum lentocellum (strain ATCC 49066 / DSM 5427 / NCIMB 11756 / RHM5) TaxID=642492 RepID=F2JR32_CELLD|nr:MULTISPECIES: DUF3298 and DUF4163 domain-containing protein [Cellulosilyticum]ADZ83890.1 Domain of unknown function DUF3298-containing protein [Cellulosilyticum lentocellum DSM 5427]QEH69274.1 DUF3298 and DUF4163 domain-containing protein [Cellulosilyticum sp. WCF-2]